MPNFTKDNAKNIALLLKKMTSEFTDKNFQDKLLTKSSSIEKATEKDLDIENGGKVAADIMTNVGLLIPYALRFSAGSLGRKKYVQSMANLLHDASSIKGMDIDYDVTETWEQIGEPGTTTESFILASMHHFIESPAKDKEAYSQLIDGLIKTSGRNKSKNVMTFAMQNGDIEFMKQYADFIEEKERKP